ncbi:MAG: PAS domain S-box protein [bacterium]|nr:PAS domain S-box protein [bacterium]
MDKASLFSDAIFVIVLGIAMARRGRDRGGPAWAGAWISPYASGVAARQVESLRAGARCSQDARKNLETQYRERIALASGMIAELDGFGNFIYAKPAFQTIQGLKSETLIGMNALALTLVDEPAPDAAHERGGMGADQRTTVVRHADDNPIPLESDIRPYLRASGEHRLVVTSRDVMARFASERQREKRREQTEQYARKCHSELNTSGIDRPLFVWGSQIELEQAAPNIVRNAIESSEKPAHVALRATKDGNVARSRSRTMAAE